ncbi:MAG: helix-turn-helix transcriptional regulator [Acidobacteria bacterium]|nr:helix-turn-helix transcriptional regulator [Thermoanaerobaculia bacterium]MBP7813099.1 helix-turn-helix transcriptional regulator [Thermoanaerobaculia bacterium]NLN10962.1 helix-turn-helix transcriptional regulator [Acidobacteriota bacterium]
MCLLSGAGQAGLTQAELGRRLRRSQAMVSAAENGAMRVGERYVKAVLRACGGAAGE